VTAADDDKKVIKVKKVKKVKPNCTTLIHSLLSIALLVIVKPKNNQLSKSSKSAFY
jgi:hypothetical protein